MIVIPAIDLQDGRAARESFLVPGAVPFLEELTRRQVRLYLASGTDIEFVKEEGTDFAAVAEGLISITPIHLDLTNHGSFGELADLTLAWP